jgi:hypothetical protein
MERQIRCEGDTTRPRENPSNRTMRKYKKREEGIEPLTCFSDSPENLEIREGILKVRRDHEAVVKRERSEEGREGEGR